MTAKGELLDLTRHGLEELEGKTVELNGAAYTIRGFAGEGAEATVHRMRNQRTQLSHFVVKVFRFRPGSAEYERIKTDRGTSDFWINAALFDEKEPSRLDVLPEEVYEAHGGLVALQQGGDDDPEYYGTEMKAAVGLLRQGDYQQAADVLDTVLAKNPNHDIALANKASCLAHLGDIFGALTLLARCFELEPNSREPYRFAAHFALSLGRPEMALSYLTSTLDRYAADFTNWRELVEIAADYDLTESVSQYIDTGMQLAREAKIVGKLKQDISASQERAQRYAELEAKALDHQHESNWTQALELLDQAIAVSKGNAIAKLNRCVCLYHLGEIAETAKAGGEIFYSLRMSTQWADALLLLVCNAKLEEYATSLAMALYLNHTLEHPADLPRIPIICTQKFLIEEADAGEILSVLTTLRDRNPDERAELEELMRKYQELEKMSKAASAEGSSK